MVRISFDEVFLVNIPALLSQEADLWRLSRRSHVLRQRLAATFLVTFASLPGVAFAQPGVDEMFANFSDSAIAIFNLVMRVSVLLGILLAGKAALSFKEYSESGGRTSLKTPVTILAVAVFLFSIPTTMGVATQTLALGGFAGPNVMSEAPSGGGLPGANAAIRGVLLFVKLVGIIAAVRGFLIFKKVGEGNSQQGVGAGLTHVLGGAAAVNIEATYNMLKASVGWS